MLSDNTPIKSVEKKRITRSWALFVLSVVLCVGKANFAGAFVQTTISPGSKQNDIAPRSFVSGSGSKLPEPLSFVTPGSSSNRRQSTELYSFMGSDGGLFGIGTPELVSLAISVALFSLFSCLLVSFFLSLFVCFKIGRSYDGINFCFGFTRLSLASID